MAKGPTGTAVHKVRGQKTHFASITGLARSFGFFQSFSNQATEVFVRLSVAGVSTRARSGVGHLHVCTTRLQTLSLDTKGPRRPMEWIAPDGLFRFDRWCRTIIKCQGPMDRGRNLTSSEAGDCSRNGWCGRRK